MYEVSEAFREAMRRPVQRQRLRGRLSSGLGAPIKFTEKNIIKNSFSLSGACSGSDNVEIGTVYTTELNVILYGLDLNRRTLNGCVVTPEFELYTSEGWEPVPLGVYTIAEANWTTFGIEIVAYDNMSKFDRRLRLTSSSGSVYDFLAMACKACGVPLGITRDEAHRLPNGTDYFSLYEENDIETWRDLVSWCAQTLGTFATIDREGRLTLRAYTADPVDTIDQIHRLAGASFSDFETRYTGLSIVNVADQTTVYYGRVPDDGLTYNLGSNPLLQYGLDDRLEEQRRAILNALAVICYTPMDVPLLGTPAYDLGDVIRFEEGVSGAEGCLGCITKYDWTFGGEYRITGVGENPAMASARSKVDKNIAGLLSQTTQDSIHYYDYVNAEPYLIPDGQRARVIQFLYATTKETHIDFHAEIKYTLRTTVRETDDEIDYTDGVLRVSYKVNGEDVIDYYPVETRPDGTHLLHLLYTWGATANIVGTFVVILEVSGCEVEIDISDCRAYIAGQGLVGDEVWDGNTNIQDDIPVINITVPSITVGAISAEMAIAAQAPVSRAFTLGVADQTIAAPELDVIFNPTAKFTVADTAGGETILIGSQYGTYPVSWDDDILSITVDADSDARILSSADDGINWDRWTGSAWIISDNGNTPAEFNTITAAEFKALAVRGSLAFKWSGAVRSFTITRR